MIIRRNQQYHLCTRSTSYVLGVYQGKFLVHLYWGDRLEEDIDLTWQAETAGVRRPAALHVRLEEKPAVFESDLRKEFAAFGNGDYGIPTFHARYRDGTTVSDFSFVEARVHPGKEKLAGLPSIEALPEDDVTTLEIVFQDDRTGLRVVLSYGVWEEFDIITRSICYENAGKETVHLLSALSMSVDFPAKPMRYLEFPGDWVRERMCEFHSVGHGVVSLASNRGYSGHVMNPFAVLAEPSTTEDLGEAFGFSIIYSGNFVINLEKSTVGTIRVAAGINPFNFDWILQPGEKFVTPEVVMVFSSQGFNGMSRRFHHLYRQRLCPPAFRNRLRPIVINNWEGTGPDFTQEKLIEIMEEGASVGAELFVLDDGWFGRHHDGCGSCGDWYCNERKIPDGLLHLSREAKKRGMQFGLWFEPEMMSPESDLYQNHPDWCLHVPGKEGMPVYGRLILDLSRPEVCEYVIECLAKNIEEAELDYVKWDCNRNMTQTADSMQAHRYILGLYRILDVLTKKYPQVLFEGCSSGGGRFDAGILPYMPQTWTSDMSDPYARLFIQHGTSYGYPPVSMTAHIGKMEVGKLGFNTWLHFAALVAMGGTFGLEMDLTLLSREEKGQLKGYVEKYKQLRKTIQYGDFYRIDSPFEGIITTWEYVDREDGQVVVLSIQSASRLNGEQHMIFLQGLDPQAKYQEEDSGLVYSGSVLMKAGFFLPMQEGNYGAVLYHFIKIEKQL